MPPNPGNSVTTIAKILGVSVGTLYNHIPGLRELRNSLVPVRLKGSKQRATTLRLGPEMEFRGPVAVTSQPAPTAPCGGGRLARALNLTSYSVRRAVAVRVLAAQPAGRSAPRAAMSRPPSVSGSSSVPW